MAGRIDFSKTIKRDFRNQEAPMTKSRVKRQQQYIRRHKARMTVLQRPEASKYRAAAIGCIATAHHYLRLYREEKARVETMNSMGPHRPWVRLFQLRMRRAGGEQEYLKTLLFYARSYLATSRRFGERADGFVLP